MTTGNNEHDPIRAYLLGILAGDERDEFERRFFTEDEVFEELLAAEDELIDDYLTGDLSTDEAVMFEKHFLVTDERRQKLRLGNAFRQHAKKTTPAPRQPIPSPIPWRWRQLSSSSLIRSVALAAVILIAAVGLWRLLIYQSDVDKGLIALNNAYREQRPVEARITHLDYAPFITTRGPSSNSVNETELRLAEMTLLTALNKKATPDVHHALGKVYLAKRDFDRAIEHFNQALLSDSTNAQLSSDLGAAYLEKAKIDLEIGRANPTSSETGKGLEDLAHSLQALNRALTLDPNLLEAQFNRALVYESMVLPLQAEEDWKKYLEKDQHSKWADEAKRKLTQLQEGKQTRSQNRVELLSEFMTARRSSNHDQAYELISRNTESLGGQLMWWQLAEAFLNPASTSDDKDQQSYLDALSYAGELQRARVGDPFISELALFYGSSALDTRMGVASAHQLINQGHSLMAKSEPAQALVLYRKAKAVFDQKGDKWDSLFATYWIGYSYQRISNFDMSLSVLFELADYCKRRNYLWLLEKTNTMIGLIHGELNQFSTAIAYQNRALETSRKIDDVYNIQKNLTVLAYYYKNLGNRTESLSYLQRGLESASTFWPGPRQMYRNYYTSAEVLNSFGYYNVAAEYEKAALLLALNEAKDPGFEHQCYIALATIYGKLRDYGEARKYAELSYEKARRLEEGTAVRPIAESYLQLAHINRQTGSHDHAISYYDKAVNLYEQMRLFAFLYEAQKGRLLAYIAQNNESRVKQELPTVLALFEQHRSKILEEKNRNSFFDLEQNIYDIAIDFEYSRTGDYQKAYEYSEISRARSLLDLINNQTKDTGNDTPDVVFSSVSQPLTLSGIRNKMPEGTQILQYAVLNDKLLTWVISKSKFAVAEHKIAEATLKEKVLNYSKSVSTLSRNVEEMRRAGMGLYEILIQPIERHLDKGKSICIVPDKVLNVLPFNALISPATGKYIINDYLLYFAPSSNTFIASSELAQQKSLKRVEKLLSVGDPTFDREAFGELPLLPSTGKEAKQIVDYYESSTLLIASDATKQRVISEIDSADIVHLASHYVIDERDPLLSKLLLTKSAEGPEHASDSILQAYEICKRKLPVTRMVVLSACQTGVEKYYSGEGMIGMSRTFLAAGVPLIVSSMWPVASEPTVELMTNFHRYRKQSELSTAEALRQAQLHMLNNSAHSYEQPFYWAPFVLIGGHARF